MQMREGNTLPGHQGAEENN